MFSNTSNSSVEPIVKRSKDIKNFKKVTKKVFIGTIVLLFLSALYARSYFLRAADDFLDAYYGNST